MNNMKLGEKNISVSFFLPKNKRTNPYAKSNLYVKNWPVDWENQQIMDYALKTFGIYGNISSHGIFEDKNIGKKYCFVAFEEQESAQKALVELNEFEIEGTDEKMYVAYAQDKATRRRTLKSKHMKFKNETNLYVKSLKPTSDAASIEKAFTKYGKVTSVCLKVHEPKNVTGTATPVENKKINLRFGFINFSTAEEAKQAFTECKKDADVIQLIDQALMTRGQEFIYYAQTKTVRQQYLRMQKKNLKTFKLIQDNVLQYYQLMKYFMPQNFRNNQRGGSSRGGGNQKGPGGRGSYNNNNNFNQGRNNFKARGGYNQGQNKDYHGNQGMQNQGFMDGGRNQHGGMNQNTPAPHGQNNQNTPAPNMMNFNNNNMMNNMPNMSGVDMQNLQAFQQQMMGAQNMNQNQTGMNNMTGIQNQMGMGMQNQSTDAVVKDLAWLKANVKEFEVISTSEKKNILGNLMYPLVEKSVHNPEHVPKITGMLIDLEVLKVSEIVEIMENTEALKDRIDEAIGIIKYRISV